MCTSEQFTSTLFLDRPCTLKNAMLAPPPNAAQAEMVDAAAVAKFAEAGRVVLESFLVNRAKELVKGTHAVTAADSPGLSINTT